VRSTLVLVALVTLAVLAVTGDTVPGAVAFLAAAVGLVAALVLGGRAVRLGRRAVTAVPLPALHRSRPAA
jgi:hypothetical protein